MNYTWDTPLPSDLQQKWTNIAYASSSTFSRYLFNDGIDGIVATAEDSTLHVFSDASMKSYGAAIYICRGNQFTLVMAKSRVSPLKKFNLPKLELMAAVIAARLVRHIQQELNLSKIELWSDSQIVLHWLQTSRSLQRFVRNRVAEIRELTENRKWRYCPTKENAADVLTRGLTAG